MAEEPPAPKEIVQEPPVAAEPPVAHEQAKPPESRVRRTIAHLVVFFVSTAFSILIIEGLTHLLGPRFSNGLEKVNTEATNALERLQPWELASQYWTLVENHKVFTPLVCEPCPHPSDSQIAQHDTVRINRCRVKLAYSGLCRLDQPILLVAPDGFDAVKYLFGDAAERAEMAAKLKAQPTARDETCPWDYLEQCHGGSPVLDKFDTFMGHHEDSWGVWTGFASLAHLVFDLFFEPVARSIVDLVQLAAGGAIAIIIYRSIHRSKFGRLKQILFLPYVLFWVFPLLTIASTTLLSIPILAAIWFVTSALHGIVGTPEASMGAIAGSASTMISAFSAKSFEAGMHEFMSTGFKRVVGRWLH